MGLMMIGGALGAMAGPVPRSGVLALMQDVELLLCCWAIVNVGSSAPRLRVLVSTWAYASIAWAVLLFLALVAGVSFLSGQNDAEGSRTSLTFLDPNYAANYWFISLMVLWATGIPRRRGRRVAAYALIIAALISTGSNGGIVSLVTGVSVATLLATYRRVGLPGVAAVGAVLVMCGYLFATHVSVTAIQKWAYASPYPFLRDGIGHGQKAVESRSALRSESVTLWREGSPLGAGPTSTKTRLREEMAPYVKEAHDDYAASLVERGAVGLVGLIALIISLLARAPALARGDLAPEFSAVVPRAHALIGSVVGTMTTMAVLEVMHLRHVWALFAIVAALGIWGRR